MKTILTLSAVLCVMSLAARAEDVAPPSDHRGPPPFAEMDANGDGSLSLAEYTEAQQERIERRFRFLDSNNDGRLSQGEIESGRDRMKKRLRDEE